MAEVPAGDWAGDAGADGVHDLAMDRRLLETFAQAMRGQCRTWFLVVRDATDQAVAQAAVCRFVVDGLETTGPQAQAVTRWVRKGIPGFMRFGVLFCGLPVPGGGNHVRVRRGADRGAVLEALDEALGRLARQTRSRLIVWREFDAESVETVAALTGRGYLRGEVPCGHTLVVPAGREFGSFADYCAALRARYRQQLSGSRRKFAALACAAQTCRGEAAAAAYTDELHALYVAVRDRATYRMETLTADFFRGVARQFGDAASLTLVTRAGRAVGFIFGLAAGDTYHNLYAGIDYGANAEVDVYFNLYFHDLDQVFRRGYRRVDLGQTSDEFKTRLGSTPRRLWYFVRATSPGAHWALRRVAKWLFPPVPQVQGRRVFKDAEPETEGDGVGG